ncbi:phospholipase A2, partial [Apiospora hydei]
TLTEDTYGKPAFPVVVFSRGLGGSRICYSAVFGELASNGLIVVAMEHHDGSAARSCVNILPSSKLTDGNRIDNTEPRTHYENNAQDNAPQNANGADTELRNAQIVMRMAEIEEAISVLSQMNCG